MSAAVLPLGSDAGEHPAVHVARWFHLAGAALVCGLLLWCCARKPPPGASAAAYEKIVPLVGTPKRGSGSSSPDSIAEISIDIPTPTAQPPPLPPAQEEGSVALLLDFAQEPLHFRSEAGQELAPPYSPSAGSAAAALAAVAEAEAQAGVEAEADAEAAAEAAVDAAAEAVAEAAAEAAAEAEKAEEEAGEAEVEVASREQRQQGLRKAGLNAGGSND